MVKSWIGPFCPQNPRKSIVYTCPWKRDMTEAGLKEDNTTNRAAWRKKLISCTSDPRWRDKPVMKKVRWHVYLYCHAGDGVASGRPSTSCPCGTGACPRSSLAGLHLLSDGPHKCSPHNLSPSHNNLGYVLRLMKHIDTFTLGMLHSQWACYIHNGHFTLTMGMLYSQWACYIHNGHVTLTMGMLHSQWACSTHNGHVIFTMGM